MGKTKQSRGKKEQRPDGILEQLKPHEAAGVLRSLLERHPELRSEACEIARAKVTGVDVDGLAAEVEDAVLAVSEEDFQGHAGRHSWGYVEPSQAAWDLLGESVEPFIDDMKRLVGLGHQAAAVASCQGIVLGLRRLKGKTGHPVLDWAPDFALEEACHAVATLGRESLARHRRRWELGAEFFESEQLEPWREALGRAARRK